MAVLLSLLFGLSVAFILDFKSKLRGVMWNSRTGPNLKPTLKY